MKVEAVSSEGKCVVADYPFNSFNFEQISQLELEPFSTGAQGFQLKIGMLMVNKHINAQIFSVWIQHHDLDTVDSLSRCQTDVDKDHERVEQIPVLVPTTYNVPQFPIK